MGHEGKETETLEKGDNFGTYRERQKKKEISSTGFSKRWEYHFYKKKN